MRSTATAYNFAFGRFGGMIGPMVVGVLIAMHYSFKVAVLALALPSILGAIAISNVPSKYSFTKKLKEEG
jgi:hypothetical protein